jgi:endonuclease G, mitochondrial
MRRAFLASVCLVLFLSGCAAHQQLHTRPALVTKHVAQEAGHTAAQLRQIADLCFMGMPVKTDDHLGPTELIYRDGYVLEFSSVDKIPYWVCEHIRNNQLGPNAERSNQFKVDPDLRGPKSTPTDYTRTGYDRGHQAPAGDQGNNQLLQDQTFFMSNMAPQFPQLNRNAWRSLETQVRTWANQYSEAYAFTGPVFYDPKEDDPQKADGTIPYYTIGTDAVAVPTHFYKIVIVKDNGAWKSIAFVMSNKKDYKSPYHLEQYIRSVEWIEEHTGLNFMPDLSSADSVKLEQNASPMWQ